VTTTRDRGIQAVELSIRIRYFRFLLLSFGFLRP